MTSIRQKVLLLFILTIVAAPSSQAQAAAQSAKSELLTNTVSTARANDRDSTLAGWMVPDTLIPPLQGTYYSVKDVVSPNDEEAWVFIHEIDEYEGDDVIWVVRANKSEQTVLAEPIVTDPLQWLISGHAAVMPDGHVAYLFSRDQSFSDANTLEITLGDTDGTWTTPHRLVTSDTLIIWDDIVADDNGNLLVAFEFDVDGVYETPMVMVYDASTAAWRDPVRLTPPDFLTGYLSIAANDDGSAIYLTYSLYSSDSTAPGMYLQRFDSETLEFGPPILIAGTSAAMQRGSLMSHHFIPAAVDNNGDVTTLFQAGETWQCGWKYYCSDVDLWGVRIEDGVSGRPTRLLRNNPNAWTWDDYSLDVSASGNVLYAFLQDFDAGRANVSAQYRPDTGSWELDPITAQYSFPARVIFRGDSDEAVAAISADEGDDFQLTSTFYDGDRWDRTFTEVPGEDFAYWTDYGVVDVDGTTFLWYEDSDSDEILGTWLE